MGILELILIIVLIFCLFGGGYGYTRRVDYGVAPIGGFGLLFFIVLIILLFKVI